MAHNRILDRDSGMTARFVFARVGSCPSIATGASSFSSLSLQHKYCFAN